MLLVETQTERPTSSASVRNGAIFVVIVGALAAYVGLATYFNFLGKIPTGELAEPVSIEVVGLDDSGHSSIMPTVVGAAPNKITGHIAEWPANYVGGSKWRIAWTWIGAIRINATVGAIQKIQSVIVQTGSDRRVFTGTEVRGKWRRSAPPGWALQAPDEEVVSLQVPWAPTRTNAINLPSVSKILQRTAISPAIAALLFGTFLFAAWRALRRPSVQRRVETLLTSEPSSTDTGMRARTALLAGLAVVTIGLSIPYSFQQYPYTQDDNFCQFLPVILRSAETLFAGHFPVWNPYQLLGAPTTTVGTYALTYPPTYLSYWIAKTFLGDVNATIEVFAVLHLLAGYLCCFFVLRKLSVTPTLSAAGAVCWALAGWFLSAGRSQFNFTPVAVYLPLLALAVHDITSRQLGMKWAAGTGLLIGVFFHAGHAEMWAYSVMFTSIAVLLQLILERFSWRVLLWSLTALLLGLALAAPLLLLQLRETANILREGATGWPVDIAHMLLPLGTLWSHGVEMGSINHGYSLEMFYAGTTFTAVGLLGFCLILAAALFAKPRWARTLAARNVWLLCGGLAFVLACGTSGVLWQVLAWLPVLSKFRWPIKYSPYMQFFLIPGGALMVARITRQRVRLQTGLFVASAALMLFNAGLCRSAWYDFGDRPYPELNSSTRQLVGENSRFLSIGPFRSPSPGFAQSLGLNFATEYSLMSFGGYDTFISTKPEFTRVERRLDRFPVATARAYGVGSVIWSEAVRNPRLSGNDVMFGVESTYGDQIALGLALQGGSAVVDVSRDRRIYKTAISPDPIAFPTADPAHRLSYSLDQSGVTVDTAGLPSGENITVNFLRWPWITANVNGKEIASRADQWDRIEVTLPSSASRVSIRYSPPWGRSFAAGGLLVLAALGTGWMASRQEKTFDRSLYA